MYYEKFIEWFEGLELYREYLSKLPEGINNPVFLSILAIILVASAISAVISHIRTKRFHARIKEKNRELEEIKIDKEIEEAKRKRQNETDNEMWNNYMKFMMMVQFNGMTSLRGMTYEQFQQSVSQNPDIIDVVSNAPSEEELEKKYWTDHVTGLFNRNAFEKKVNDVEISILGIVSIDANDLKKTNDTQGHDAGDRLLKGIADAMRDVWGEDKSFRTGGDEFTVILAGVNRKVTEGNIVAFKEILSDNNLSAATGFANASDVKGIPTIEKIIKLSDEMMYADKRAFKQARAEAEEAGRKAEEARLAEEQAKLEEEQARIEEEQARIEEERINAEREAAERAAEEAKRLDELRLIEEARRKEEELLKSISDANISGSYTEDDYEASYSGNLELPELMEEELEPEEEEAVEDSILQAVPVVEEENDVLTSEQQNDFAKLVAMMKSESKQKEQIKTYNEQKAAITKQNEDVLNKKLQNDMENAGSKKSGKSGASGDDIDSLHKAALAAMEAEEAGKGKKKGLFKKK